MDRIWTLDDRLETVQTILRRLVEVLPPCGLRLDLGVALYVLDAPDEELNQNQREIDRACHGPMA